MGGVSKFTDALVEDICARLAEGESLSAVCRSDGMPAWSTVHEWLENDEGFAGRVMRARETGYLKRADDAVLEAKGAEDAALGRLAFDAERWYLGKLSNAFSDKQKHEVTGPNGGPLTHLVEARRDLDALRGSE